METDVKKIFNYICDRRGCISFNGLLKHPSPVANLSAEEVERKLERIAENHRCFVLERKNGQISAVTMYFKTRLCINYMENKCEEGKTCKYWHICKAYMERTCTKTSCLLSHDFKDEQNMTKIQELQLSHLNTNAIRNILSNCLPHLCIKYVTSSCIMAENCLDLHLCPNLVESQKACSDTNCPFEHNLNSKPNVSVLRKADLAGTLREKVIFSHILLSPELKSERGKNDRVTKPMTTAKNNKPDKTRVMFECVQSHSHRLNNLNQEAETSRSGVKEFVANEFGEETLTNEVERKLHKKNEKPNKEQTEISFPGNNSPEGKRFVREVSIHCGASERDSYQKRQMAPSAKLNSKKNIISKNKCHPSKKEDGARADLKGERSNVVEVSQAVKSALYASSVTPELLSSKTHLHGDGLLPTPISFMEKKGEIKGNQLGGLLPIPVTFAAPLSSEAVQTGGENEANKDGRKELKNKRQEGEKDSRDVRNRKGKAGGEEGGNKAGAVKGGRRNEGKRERQRKRTVGEKVLNGKGNAGIECSVGGRGRGSSKGADTRRRRGRGRGNGRGTTRDRENTCVPSSAEVASTCSSCDIASVHDIWEDETFDDFSGSEGPTASQLSDNLSYSQSQSSILSQGSMAGNWFFASQTQRGLPHQPMVPTSSKTDPYELIPMPFDEKAASELNKSVFSSAATRRREPLEKDVFDYLVIKHKSVAKFSVITAREDLFPSEFKDKEEWFRKRRNTFLVSENEKGEIEEVRAYSRSARLCFHSERCKKDDCRYFHLCRSHVAGQCTLGGTCNASHDLTDPRDTRNLKRYNLQHLTSDQFCHLLRESSPQVCNDYNKTVGRCPRGKRCIKLHICQKFVRKACVQERSCNLDHEATFSSNHSRNILAQYGLDKAQPTVVLRVLLICHETQGMPSKPTHQLEGEFIHKDLKERSICMDFILGRCRKGSPCDMHHCRQPYIWQYHDPHSRTWISFKTEESEAIEKSFCDPSVMACSHTLDLSSLHSTNLPKVACLYNVNFNKMTIQSQRNDSCPETSVKLRRLSTESHILHEDVAVATKWVWYWNNGPSFEQYGGAMDDKMQKEIESFFLDKEECYPFKFKEHRYKLYFSEMYQINLNPVYLTKRTVRRRPIFRELNELSQLIQKSRADARKEKESSLPSEWMKMKPESDFERFKLPPKNKEFLEIKKLFRQTVSDSKAEVIAIERVQNQFMWEKYQRKKEQMQRRAGSSSVDERMLFHGTSPELIDNICKENFDWRLSGKTNGARYGQGSYFARDAEYSSHYTGNKTSGCSRYMFVAKVLVGSYTEGKPELRKPPTKSSGELYDSCVDHVINPKIFVVFDIDQYYPSHVIEFADKASEDTAGDIYNGGNQSAYNTYNQGNARYTSYNQKNAAYATYNQGISGSNSVTGHGQGTNRYISSSPSGSARSTADTSYRKTSSSARNVGHYGGGRYSAATSQSHVTPGGYGGSRNGISSSYVESDLMFSSSDFSSPYGNRGNAYTPTSSTLGDNHATAYTTTSPTNTMSTEREKPSCSVM